MKAAVWNGPNDLTIKEVPRPAPSKGEVLIETKVVGICGSDLGIYEGGFEKAEPPLIIGHEGGGIIRAVGEGVSTLKEGHRVVVTPILYCGSCDYCKQGRYSLCDNEKTIGMIGAQGEYAEYFVAPERNCHFLPDGITWAEAGLVDTLAGPVLAIGRVNLPLGATVAVFGPGPAGLFFAKLAKLRGASEVYLVGTRDERLRLGREYGADVTINVRRENTVEIIKNHTHGRGVDIVIEAAGSVQALNEGLEVLRKAGTLLVYGVFGGEVSVDMQRVLLHELNLFGVCDNTEGYPLAIKLLQTGEIPVEHLITHTLELDDLPKAFSSGLIKERREGYIKGVVLF